MGKDKEKPKFREMMGCVSSPVVASGGLSARLLEVGMEMNGTLWPYQP